MLLALLAAAALVLVVLRMDRRHARGFRESLAELHRERSRFWRARLQADEPGADAVELGVRAQQHLSRVRALADRLTTRHRDAAAGTWVATPEFTRELREMEDALAGSGWSREAAPRRMEHARREAASAGEGGGTAGVRLVLPRGVLPGAIAFLTVAAFIAWWSGPPLPPQRARVMRQMVAATGCPRPMPRVWTDSVQVLGAAERCAVVWTAASALRSAADAPRGDTAGLRVLRMDEMHASSVIDVVPGWGIKGRPMYGWMVMLGTSRASGGIYTVFVDQRTGRAQIKMRSPPR